MLIIALSTAPTCLIASPHSQPQARSPPHPHLQPKPKSDFRLDLQSLLKSHPPPYPQPRLHSSLQSTTPTPVLPHLQSQASASMHQLTVHSRTEAKQHQLSEQPEAHAKQHHCTAQPHRFSAQQCSQSMTALRHVSAAQPHTSWVHVHARSGRKHVPLSRGVGLIKLCIPGDSCTPRHRGINIQAVTTAGSAAAASAAAAMDKLPPALNVLLPDTTRQQQPRLLPEKRTL
ncbi:TPA: hypothetical protein ACH3X1_000162 [Trebouxia sp. C0004]